MIRNYLFIITILLAIEGAVLALSQHNRTKKFFGFLPAVFWIYFLPLLVSSAGWIDAKSPVYQIITNNFLPASLLLLLSVVDVRAILKLGRKAIAMFFLGSLGIMLGTAFSFFIFKSAVGSEFWSGFGALSGSWTGGSANMIAVKEAISTPEQVFSPMVIVDTIVPYVWMGILVALVPFQKKFDQWSRSDKKVLDELARRSEFVAVAVNKPGILVTAGIFVLALAGSFSAQYFASFFPVIKDVISTYAWTIIIISAMGILFSFTPVRKLEGYGASRTGYFLLYFVLTTIGAKANLANVGSSVILILAGFLIVAVHITVLILSAKVMKAPMFLVSVSSQANIGGVASAPIVAEIYQPGLASVGLLLAILGNIAGTYLGIITSRVCFWVANF